MCKMPITFHYSINHHHITPMLRVHSLTIGILFYIYTPCYISSEKIAIHSAPGNQDRILMLYIPCTMFYLSFHLPTVVHYTMFLHSHISSCFYMFQCLLTPTSGSFNPTVVLSQYIKWWCVLTSCLLKTVVFPLNIPLPATFKYFC
jgi:hypothetical protein